MNMIGARPLSPFNSASTFPSRASMQIEQDMPGGGYGPADFNYFQRSRMIPAATKGGSEVWERLLITLRPDGR